MSIPFGFEVATLFLAQKEKYKRGFTLLELLIAIVILGIISTVAMTGYKNHLVKSRRAEAHTALISILAQAEQFFLQNNSYPSSISDLTAPASQYYTYTATSCGTNCFRVTATAKGSQATDDVGCTPLTLDTQGARTPVDGKCWNR